MRSTAAVSLLALAALTLAPEARAFRVWIQGDTQKLVEASDTSSASPLNEVTRGLCERHRELQKQGSSIARIVHVGDIVQLHYSTTHNQGSACRVCDEELAQWERAGSAYAISEGCGIPGSFVLGNHDMKGFDGPGWANPSHVSWWRASFHGSSTAPLRDYGEGPSFWFDNPRNDPGSVGGIDAAAIQHVAGDYFVVLLPYLWTQAMEDWVVERLANEPGLRGKKFILASHVTIYPPAGAPTEYDPAAGSPMRVASATAAVLRRLERPVALRGAGANVVAVVGGHYRANVDLGILVPFAWDVEPGGSYLRVFANAQSMGQRGAHWGVMLEVDEQSGEICVWDEDVTRADRMLWYGGSRLCATPR